MARRHALRPVLPEPPARTSPTGSPANRNSWPAGSQELARALHGQLRLDARDWHALKGQPQRRAAEQLAAALVHLLDPANPPAAAEVSAQRRQATELLEHALGWLKGELRDPGCPSHGR